MCLFAIGTLYGALSPNTENLITARVIQGLVTGMMTPVSIALISELYPPEKRGRMIGAFSFVQLIANLLSSILGSFITKQLGWHWIFYITFALVLVAILLIVMDRKTSMLRLPNLCLGQKLTCQAGRCLGCSVCWWSVFPIQSATLST